MNGNNCKSTCWLIALAAGCVIGLYFWVGADWGFFWSLIAGVIVCVMAGVFLPRFFCSDEAEQNNASAASVAPRSSAAPAPVPEPEPTPEPTPETTLAIAPTAEPAPETTPESAPAAIESTAEPLGSMIKPSTGLPGQNELADRKGTWRYQGDMPVSSADQSAVPAPAAPASPEAPASVLSQPEGLGAARSGGADDLKMIKGVGPKLEEKLNILGFFHFDQIAGWGAADVAWVDENLVGFKGRVSRDNWVDQAKALAAGEETEFARRAKKDGIYN